MKNAAQGISADQRLPETSPRPKSNVTHSAANPQSIETASHEVLAVTPRIQIPLSEFQFEFSRSSGPGGQNVNKVNSKVGLRWRPLASTNLPDDVRQRFLTRFASKLLSDGSVLITCEKSRSQLLNREGCLDQLRRWLLEVAVPPKRRHPTKPTKASKTRRLNEKRRRSDTKRLRGSLGDQ